MQNSQGYCNKPVELFKETMITAAVQGNVCTTKLNAMLISAFFKTIPSRRICICLMEDEFTLSRRNPIPAVMNMNILMYPNMQTII
ncbi:hypothetical protein T07_379 [Trichinella nelsoni]|uniref:Uncharacterized protein n=1 Tax=Trichinella nelsoni TaxID=6336 RepID=A0A0V0SCU7_9BILA|nr:hypothetical protein T07_379 [Trichinella nelsoni]